MTASWTPHPMSFTEKTFIQTPPSQSAQTMFSRPHEAELKRHPNPLLPKQSIDPTGQGCHAGMWDDAFTPLGHGADDVGTDNWATKRKTPASYNYSTPSYLSTSHPSANVLPWMSTLSDYSRKKSDEWEEHPTGQEKQVMVTLRDDQLGQIVDALSPPKHDREISRTPSALYHANGQKTTHNYFSSKSVAVPYINRPSSAFPARKPSYPGANTLSSQKYRSQDGNKQTTPGLRRPHMSTRDEDIDPPQLRLQTPSPRSNITLTPNLFVQRQPAAVPDISAMDWPSAHSSIRRLNRGEAPMSRAEINRLDSAHGPASINTRSRKENSTSDTPKVLNEAIRHDQTLTQTASPEPRLVQGSISKGHKAFPYHDRRNIPDLVEIIDVDALDPDLNITATEANMNKPSPFQPTHKSDASISSTNSTVRLERQLFSALGEELGSFDHRHHHHMDTTDMGSELAQALCAANTHSERGGSVVLESLTTSDFEPTGKRKRQGTLGGERSGSPMSKREKAEEQEQEERVGMVGLGGD